MSDYEPQDGDRVRVVLEGAYRSNPFVERIFYVGEHPVYDSLDVDMSIEKVAPQLPTTPGSVIRIDGRFVRVRTRDGWINPEHGPDPLAYSDDTYTAYGWDVLFDAGAQ